MKKYGKTAARPIVNPKKLKEGRREMPVIAVFLLICLIIYSASLIFMIVWGFINSLKAEIDFSFNLLGLPMTDGKFLPPAPGQRGGYDPALKKLLPITKWEWGNYVNAYRQFKTRINYGMTVIDFKDMFFNSVTYALMGSFIAMTTTWAMAYISAQFPFKLSKFIYSLDIILMLVPIVGSLPSALQAYMKLGLYDTWGYVIMSNIWFIGSDFLIFYAFFSTVSKEIKEAAEIDGAGNWSIMLRIIFPMTSRMYFVLLLSSFIGRWNDYMTMIIWLPSKPNLAYGMYDIQTRLNASDTPITVQLAASMIVMLPILTLFLIFKDKLIGRVSIGQLK